MNIVNAPHIKRLIMSTKTEIDVQAIIESYLREYGYGGLHDEDVCGCELGDLIPCNRDPGHCKPGLKIKTGKGLYDWRIR